ncbi:hypothetical protein [Roseivirga pacifica]|nr:hypothetical protein [Roseivirga pacifica]MCO6370487.1 hypothetical protein [Roseivirga pacifica]MCO6379896.1 hypothetical protein [Roseivirga pacifica]
MKNKNILIVMLGLIVGVFGCADPDLAPILTFDDAKKAGYVKLIEESDKLVNVLDEQSARASTYTYSVEFVDQQNGQRVEEYYVNLVYEPVSGSDQTVDKLISFTQADFVDGPNGLRAKENISVTGDQIMNALGLSFADLSPGDNFVFKGYLTFEGDGAVYGADNASAAVNGSAFAGHFDFTLPAACPSDLTGSYDYDGSLFWCNAGSGSGQVDIVAQGGGVYHFSDWSFGAYTSCYGGIDNSTSLTFTDVCTEVSFTGTVDKYGDTWNFTSTIVGNDWTIIWDNTYGESGSAVIHYTGGANWPITLN